MSDYGWPEGASDRVIAVLRAELATQQHTYCTVQRPDPYTPSYKQTRFSPACSCGWIGEYGENPFIRWQSQHMAEVQRQAEVDSGKRCLICEERDADPDRVLCRTNHCDTKECTKRCRWCMDELRDERD